MRFLFLHVNSRPFIRSNKIKYSTRWTERKEEGIGYFCSFLYTYFIKQILQEREGGQSQWCLPAYFFQRKVHNQAHKEE